MINTVLLIDDDDTVNYLNKRIINKIGFAKNILVAKNGFEGLQNIQNLSDNGAVPDLILLDLKMPVMDGFAFLKAYSENVTFSLSKSKIIVLSTSTNLFDMERLQQFGIKSIWEKPLKSENLTGYLQENNLA